MSFPATRWTLIIAAGQAGNAGADEALEELCKCYWYPVYAFVRRAGNLPADTEDLTQDFFLRFLKRRHIASADPTKGRFRSFLLTSVKNFLADQADRRHAAKRGGTDRVVPLDFQEAEHRYVREFATQETPERLFEREWARTLVAGVTDDLRLAFSRERRTGYFDHLRGFLPGSDETISYADAAARLHISEGAVKVAVHRLRRRYREVFQSKIAVLVSDPDSIEDEIQHVLQILRN